MNLKLTAAAALLLGTATVTPAMANTRLVVNCFWPPQHFTCSDILPKWLDDVEAATEGRVKGNIPPRSVAPPPDQLASVEKGIVDAAIQFNGLIANRVTGPLVAMNPFVGSEDAPAMSQALWETNQKFFPDEFDTVHLLTQWVITPAQLFSTTDTPVTTLEDFASRKVWALPGPLANMAAELGAGVVSTPAVGSNEVISRGVVDAHLGMSGDALAAFQLLPYSKSRTKFTQPIYSTSFSLVINKDKWAEISPEDQAAITALSGPVLGMTLAAKWDSVGAAVYEREPHLGAGAVPADPAFEEALIKAGAPVTAAWVEAANAAGIDGQGALDFYMQRVKDLSK